jgi:hypothetical protein
MTDAILFAAGGWMEKDSLPPNYLTAFSLLQSNMFSEFNSENNNNNHDCVCSDHSEDTFDDSSSSSTNTPCMSPDCSSVLYELDVPYQWPTNVIQTAQAGIPKKTSRIPWDKKKVMKQMFSSTKHHGNNRLKHHGRDEREMEFLDGKLWLSRIPKDSNRFRFRHRDHLRCGILVPHSIDDTGRTHFMLFKDWQKFGYGGNSYRQEAEDGCGDEHRPHKIPIYLSANETRQLLVELFDSIGLSNTLKLFFLDRYWIISLEMNYERARTLCLILYTWLGVNLPLQSEIDNYKSHCSEKYDRILLPSLVEAYCDYDEHDEDAIRSWKPPVEPMPALQCFETLA